MNLTDFIAASFSSIGEKYGRTKIVAISALGFFAFIALTISGIPDAPVPPNREPIMTALSPLSGLYRLLNAENSVVSPIVWNTTLPMLGFPLNPTVISRLSSVSGRSDLSYKLVKKSAVFRVPLSLSDTPLNLSNPINSLNCSFGVAGLNGNT